MGNCSEGRKESLRKDGGGGKESYRSASGVEGIHRGGGGETSRSKCLVDAKGGRWVGGFEGRKGKRG